MIRTRVAEGGRIVIPAEFRKALGLKVGDEVILDLNEGQVTLLTAHQAIRRAQALIRDHISEDSELAAELISERRAEAEDE